MDQLRSLFTNFIHVNYNSDKRVLSWRDIEEKNSGMVCKAFLKMIRRHELIPHVFNVETLQEFIASTIPPMTSVEYEYFDSCELVIEYEKD
jgi:hypothetical protein